MTTITGIAGLKEGIAPDLEDKRIPVNIKQQILRAIATTEYGSVEVVIHDGKVVQIECQKKSEWVVTTSLVEGMQYCETRTISRKPALGNLKMHPPYDWR